MADITLAPTASGRLRATSTTAPIGSGLRQSRLAREPEPVLYKIPEVMAMLRMSRGALYQEMSAGRLRKVKRGRSVFVTAAAIADYVALLEQETEATAG